MGSISTIQRGDRTEYQGKEEEQQAFHSVIQENVAPGSYRNLLFIDNGKEDLGIKFGGHHI